jgi:hypothetical protein
MLANGITGYVEWMTWYRIVMTGWASGNTKPAWSQFVIGNDEIEDPVLSPYDLGRG